MTVALVVAAFVGSGAAGSGVGVGVGAVADLVGAGVVALLDAFGDGAGVLCFVGVGATGVGVAAASLPLIPLALLPNCGGVIANTPPNAPTVPVNINNARFFT